MVGGLAGPGGGRCGQAAKELPLFYEVFRLAQPRWIDVRDGTSNRLLFRYDPARRLVSIKHSGMAAAVVVDLLLYEPDEGEKGGGAILGAVNGGVHGKTLPDGV